MKKSIYSVKFFTEEFEDDDTNMTCQNYFLHVEAETQEQAQEIGKKYIFTKDRGDNEFKKIVIEKIVEIEKIIK